jgi:hypothetical protein
MFRHQSQACEDAEVVICPQIGEESAKVKLDFQQHAQGVATFRNLE